MVDMKMNISSSFSWLVDLFWPRIDSWSQEKENEENEKLDRLKQNDLSALAAMPDETNTITSAKETVKFLSEEERDRKESVASRLKSIIGLASVSATLALGFQAWIMNIQHSANHSLSLLLSVINLYVVVQLVCALLASVKGLQGSPYLMLVAEDLVQKHDEEYFESEKRIMCEHIMCIHFNQKLNTEKFQHLAVAHRALKNYLWGILLLVLTLGTLNYYSSDQKLLEERLLRQIRAEAQTLELLRGPQGLQGVQGQKGERGERGMRGLPSKSCQ
jgi:hypothetical protein